MRYGIILTTGDARTLVELAEAAQAAGWDGVFYWDAIAIGDAELYDPWVVLGAMAARTERVRLGLIVAAPTRRRPWKLARETITVDRLSGGRLVLPVGLGALDDAGFANVGEETGIRERAERLDETLAILDGLWSGEPFGFDGRHYRFAPMTFHPTPVQRPRIPVWVVGAWPSARSMRRVVRWDGVVAQALGKALEPADVRGIAEFVRRERADGPPGGGFDVVVDGTTGRNDAAGIAKVRSFAEAGATWWIESDWNANPTSLRRRIEEGPPRIE